MNKKKRNISFIAQIILIFSIIFSALAIFTKSVALNKNTYINILNKNNTYLYIEGTIYEKMDKVLGSNIDTDIKKSIIAEEDIKREADTLITGLIQYLKTGENNIEPIDTKIYEERIEKAINLILADFAGSSSKDLSFNDIQFENMASTKSEFQFNNMVLLKEELKSGQDSFYIEKLMSASEAEDKIRSLLKEKGLTEAEARQKVAEKGITKEQALEILEGYGITIDDEVKSGGSGTSSSDGNNNEEQTSSGNSNSTPSQNSQGNSTGQNEPSEGGSVNSQASENINSGETTIQESQDSNSDINNNDVSFMSKLQDEIIEAIITNDGKTIEEKLDVIEDKVSNEAAIKMNAEIEKMNPSKLLESNAVKYLAKIISAFYKMFWLFMILPIVPMIVLIKLNDWKLYPSLRWIGSAFIIAGLFIFIAFFGAYVSKFYENIVVSIINSNTIYIKDIILITIKSLLKSLSILGIITFSKGLLLLIPTVKNSLVNKTKN